MNDLNMLGTVSYIELDAAAMIIIIAIGIFTLAFFRQMERKIDWRMIVITANYVGYLFINVIWTAGDYFGIWKGRAFYFFNGLSYMTIAVSTVYFLLYVLKKVNFKYADHPAVNLILSIPAFIHILLAVTASSNKLLFELNAQKEYVDGPWYSMFSYFLYSYMLVAGFIAFIKGINTMKGRRGRYYTLSLYSLPIVIFDILQKETGTNFTNIGYMLSVIIIFSHEIIGFDFSLKKILAEKRKNETDQLERIWSIFNGIPTNAFMKDAETGKYVAANNHFAEYAGKDKASDVIGLDDYALFDRQMASYFVKDDKLALSKNEPHIVYEETKDARGNTHSLQTIKMKFEKVDGSVNIFGMSIDVTESITLRNELKNKELINAIAGLTEDFELVIRINLDTMEDEVFREVGNRSNGASGWKDIKTFSERLDYLKERYVHPEDKESFRNVNRRDIVLKELREKKVTYNDYRVLLADGKEEYWQIKYILIGGKTEYALAGFHSVDDYVRKDMEMRNQLEKQQVALKEALTLANAANRAKTSFLNNMSHDIRTPMNAIVGYAGLAEANIDDREKVSEYLKKINASSEHLLSLINDVLDMSRIESGKMNLSEKEEDIIEIVSALQNIIQADVTAKKIDFVVDVSKVTDNFVFVDRLRINQMLLNILSNAVKYTGEGGRISFTVVQNGVSETGYGIYEFRIKDNGIGMSKQMLKNAFKPFERGNTSSVSGIQGSGLGMAIARSIAVMVGGNISIESEEGKGTEVIITSELRIANRHKKAAPVNKRKEEKREKSLEKKLSGKHVLMAEDNVINTEIANEILHSFNITVENVTNGKEAYERIRDGKPEEFDLILMDIQMPLMNGYEATRRIRELPSYYAKNIPIIAMTANAFTKDRNDAFDAGMNEHISKPIKVDVLKETLARFLD